MADAHAAETGAPAGPRAELAERAPGPRRTGGDPRTQAAALFQQRRGRKVAVRVTSSGGPEPQNHQPRGHRVLTTVTDESIMTRATAKTTYTVWNFPKTELQKGKVKSEGSEGGLIAGVATAVRSARGDSRAGRGLQREVTRPVSARPARGARLGRASRPLLKTAQDGHPPGGDRGSRRLCERSGLGFPGPLRKAHSLQTPSSPHGTASPPRLAALAFCGKPLQQPAKPLLPRWVPMRMRGRSPGPQTWGWGPQGPLPSERPRTLAGLAGGGHPKRFF